MRKFLKSKRSKTRKKIEWLEAPDIKKSIKFLVDAIDIDWVQVDQVHCFRSNNANTRAYARIWGLSRVWQQALGIPATYVLEVISEKFDNLPQDKKDEVLLHELAHIPRNFSGSLVPHTRHGAGSFHDKLHQMIIAYKKSV